MRTLKLQPYDARSRLKVIDGKSGRIGTPRFIKMALTPSALEALMVESAVVLHLAREISNGRRLTASNMRRLEDARARLTGVSRMLHG